MSNQTSQLLFDEMAALGSKGPAMTDDDIRRVITIMPTAFRQLIISSGVSPTSALALTTKFRDAGRRSAPWSAFSRRVPGRPQDGKDGNRINRWLLPQDHKFYSDERNGTLVEIKYYLQILSMEGAPSVPNAAFNSAFSWLLGFDVVPGAYLDPIMLTPIVFDEVIGQPRIITSGHINPLDRGGKHTHANTFLMLKESNSLQGNKTLPELLDMISGILKRHGR